MVTCQTGEISYQQQLGSEHGGVAFGFLGSVICTVVALPPYCMLWLGVKHSDPQTSHGQCKRRTSGGLAPSSAYVCWLLADKRLISHVCSNLPDAAESGRRTLQLKPFVRIVILIFFDFSASGSSESPKLLKAIMNV